MDGRAALSRARTREAQAIAVDRLADEHQAAADRLRTEFGTAARAVIAGLEGSGRAYAALGTAASDGSAARFRAAGREVRVAEAGLTRDIDRTREAAMRNTSTSISPSPTDTPSSPARPFVTQPMFAILLLLGSCVAGFALTGPLGNAIARARRDRAEAGRA